MSNLCLYCKASKQNKYLASLEKWTNTHTHTYILHQNAHVLLLIGDEGSWWRGSEPSFPKKAYYSVVHNHVRNNQATKKLLAIKGDIMLFNY